MAQKDAERGIRWAKNLATLIEVANGKLLEVVDFVHAQTYFFADKVDEFVSALDEEIAKEEAKHALKHVETPVETVVETPTETPVEVGNLAKVQFVRQFLSKAGVTNNIWFTDKWKTELPQDTLDYLYDYVKDLTEKLGGAGHPLFRDK